MSRKANRKCEMCGCKVKPGQKLCPACQAWKDAGDRPMFYNLDDVLKKEVTQ